MKITILLFIWVSTLSQTFARTLECSTSNSDLRLSQWSKSGGASPAEGMLLSTTKLIYKNNLVFENNTYHEREATPTLESNIKWSFIAKTEIYLTRSNTGYSNSATFAVQIELHSSDGEIMTGMGTPELKDWFICQNEDQLLP